jgi:hypothetical protein
MAKSDIQVLNEMYDNITRADNQQGIKAIYSVVRRGGEIKVFDLTDEQKALFAKGIGATLLDWSKEGPGEIADGLEAFVMGMRQSMGYVPGIDPEELTIDALPNGTAGGVLLNGEDQITLINPNHELYYRLDDADEQILLAIVNHIAMDSQTLMHSPEQF